ncbi:MAG: hypothetical protein EXR77_15970 [Myxococcales bacterium]|nr:hypothetical protein [Myxococcales bacterium]
MIAAYTYFDAPTVSPDRDAAFDLRLLAPLGRWPLRLVALVTMLPLLHVQWGAFFLGVVAFGCALQMLPSLWLVGWGKALRQRSQAAVKVGNRAGLGALHGTAIAMAIAMSLSLGLLFWLSADSLAVWLCPGPCQQIDSILAYLKLEAVQVACWPLLVTWTALAEGRQSDNDRAAFRGTVVAIESMAALSVAIFQWPPTAWPLAMTAAHATLIAVSVLVLWRDRVLSGKPQWSTAEAKDLIWATEPMASAEPGMLPVVFACVILPAAAQRPQNAAVPAALVAVIGALCATCWQIVGRLEPVTDMPDMHADPYRARWRFGRSLDAAVLMAVGVGLIVAAYGTKLTTSWLGLGATATVTAVPMAWLMVVSAPVAVSAQWLSRGDHQLTVAGVRIGEAVVALTVSALLWPEFGWVGAAWAVALVRTLTTAMWLPIRVCNHLGMSPNVVFGGLVWRLGLVALPAGVTALAFAALKPPRTGREWIVQLLIVMILYVIPAFAAWSLMDTRRDRD